MKLRKHIFVCTNERPEGHPRGSCKAKGSEEVLKAFKEEVLKQRAKLDVRAQKAGCLDTCEHGVCVVVYPDDVWYGGVKVDDVPVIVREHVMADRPVKSLIMPGK